MRELLRTWSALLVISLLFVALCGASGCGQRINKQDDIKLTVSNYHNHLRWGRYADASNMMDPADREEFLGRHDELGDGYKVVELELKSLSFKSETEVETKVVMQWLREPNMTVRKDKLVETWHRVGDAWLLTDVHVESK